MDINEMIENEIEDSRTIRDLIKDRYEINSAKKELDERRKDIDESLNKFMEENEIQTIEADELKVSIVSRRGSVKWDKDKLQQFLTPMELEQSHSIGKGSSYIKVAKDDK
tara:strand:+ start:312 stop:641 length:330 start_codon:yes stop_codon:yes gene_type:complete